MPVDVILEDTRWSALGLEHLVDRVFGAISAQFDWPVDAYEVALLACNDGRIATLNADFRGKPTPTNVLSWPAVDYEVPVKSPTADELGDIALAYETCVAEATAQGKTIESHVCHLFVHGVLHLLGFDHVTEDDATYMERTEVEILAKLGIADPY